MTFEKTRRKYLLTYLKGEECSNCTRILCLLSFQYYLRVVSHLSRHDTGVSLTRHDIFFESTMCCDESLKAYISFMAEVQKPSVKGLQSTMQCTFFCSPQFLGFPKSIKTILQKAACQKNIFGVVWLIFSTVIFPVVKGKRRKKP